MLRKKAGLVVAIGHTDATYEQARAAIAHGAQHAVHVYNAMRPFSHRDSGVIGAVLTTPNITAELIADNVHVEDAAMRLLLQAKSAGLRNFGERRGFCDRNAGWEIYVWGNLR